MQCPVCSKDVKTAASLRKHAMGRRDYGGHAHSLDEAEVLLHRARSSERRSCGSSGGDRHAGQFERRVDIVVTVFLPDVLAASRRWR